MHRRGLPLTCAILPEPASSCSSCFPVGRSHREARAFELIACCARLEPQEAFGMSNVELGAEDQGSCRLIQQLGQS